MVVILVSIITVGMVACVLIISVVYMKRWVDCFGNYPTFVLIVCNNMCVA